MARLSSAGLTQRSFSITGCFIATIVLAVVSQSVVLAQSSDDSQEQNNPDQPKQGSYVDITEPRADATAALVGPLHTATIATTNLEANLLFYRDGMGLRVTGPVELSESTKSAQRQLWGIPQEIDWETYLLTRDNVDQAIQIQLLVLDTPTEAIHRSWDSLELGPFSLGFPNTQQAQLDARLRRLGFGAQSAMSEYSVGRPDGSSYLIQETIFNGPEFVKGVGIYRGDGMKQLSPVDPNTGLGGPGYSAQIVSDGDETIRFFTEFLDLELRADRQWKTSGALGAPAGTEYRFMIVYAKGATSRHLLLLDYLSVDPIDAGVARRLPNRGLGAWTFQVTDIDAMVARAEAHNVTIVQPPLCYRSPHLGRHCAMTVLSPDGFLIELAGPDDPS